MSDDQSPETTQVATESIDLLMQQLAPEYRQLVEEFQRQNNFYADFVSKAQTGSDQPGLQGFWNFPSSAGFETDHPGQQNPWLDTLFQLSGSTDTLGARLFLQFSADVNVYYEKIFAEIQAFQKAANALSQQQRQLAEQAQKIFQERIQDIDPKDSEQLCRAWLQSGEAAYKSLSNQDEFTDNQSALFNSVSKLKSLQGQLAGKFSAVFGFPQQDEIDDLQRGLHELRLAFAEYRETATQKIAALEQKLKQTGVRKRSVKSSS